MLIVVLGAGAGPIPGVFPAGGMSTPGVTGFFPVLGDELRHLVLPCLTYVATVYAQLMLIMRASLLEEKDSDYITTARAKGLRDSLVLRRHAVPNALLPTVTQVSLNLGAIVSSTAILVETVFSWPGLGLLFYQALSIPDLPLLEGLFLFFSASVIVMNLIADLLYPLLDPRVRTS
jgi:peptide/nickel transport system permease protein